MQARLETLVEGKQPADIKKLVFDGTVGITNIVGLDRYTNLELLSLNGVGLSTLEGFPTLPHLKKLELNDNKITGPLNALSKARLYGLERLNVAGNKIADLTDLDCLSKFPNITHIDIAGCPVCDKEGFSSQVFSICKKLVSLNGAGDDGEDVEVRGWPPRRALRRSCLHADALGSAVSTAHHHRLLTSPVHPCICYRVASL